MGKRVRDLKDELRQRRWGDDTGPKVVKGTGSNDIAVGGHGERNKGKRLGKKERLKMKVVAEDVEGSVEGARTAVGGEVPVGDGTGEGEGIKKRRKKKKKDKAGYGALVIYD